MAYRFNLNSMPKENVVVCRFKGNVIMSSQNLIQIIGHQKSGKSLVSTDILVGALTGDSTELGFNFVKVPEGKKVYYFDTEMSESEFFERMKKVAEISGGSDQLEAYNLIEESYKERVSYIHQESVNDAHIIIVDGVVDLCKNFNDEEESLKVIAALKTVAMRNNCPVVAILHTNPGERFSGDTKGKGHLGTLLSNKVQSTIVLQKLKSDVFKMSFKDLRNSGKIDESVYFEYDEKRIYRKSDKSTDRTIEDIIIKGVRNSPMTSKEIYNYVLGYKSVSWPTVTRAISKINKIQKNKNNKYTYVN